MHTFVKKFFLKHRSLHQYRTKDDKTGKWFVQYLELCSTLFVFKFNIDVFVSIAELKDIVIIDSENM